VLKGDQPQKISFMTSVTARISVVELSSSMKTSCALHDITKYGTIFFASSTAAAVTKHIKKQQLTSVER
jgi:general stress protein 26